MTAHLSRRALAAGLLATIPAPAVALAKPAPVEAGRGGGERLPTHDALWSRLPLPFTLAQAWGMLTPETQAEIGVAVISQHLAEYIYGDGLADADLFLDDDLRDAACDVQCDILNRMGGRLWTLFPDLYGPDGDHPRWAIAGNMVLPLGIVVQLPPPTPPPASDPIFQAIKAAAMARREHRAIFADLDESDDAQMDRLDALVSADCAAFAALSEVIPTTRAGDVALADFYLSELDDPDGNAIAYIEHLRAVLAGGFAQ